jgi:hypothetical protein
MMNYIILSLKRYEVEVRDMQFGMEQITAQLPMKSANAVFRFTSVKGNLGSSWDIQWNIAGIDQNH